MTSDENTPSPVETANDNMPEAMVFIIIGQARLKDSPDMQPFNCILAAPDDDTAVRMALESLAAENYTEADLHQIGNMEGRPQDDEEEMYGQAYDAALQGEIAIIAFDGYDFED